MRQAGADPVVHADRGVRPGIATAAVFLAATEDVLRALTDDVHVLRPGVDVRAREEAAAERRHQIAVLRQQLAPLPPLRDLGNG
jgi:hypothetical protein